MTPFPKPIKRVDGFPRGSFILSKEQEDWFKRYFPTNKNTYICKAMGVCLATVYKFAKKYGLHKTDETKARIWRANSRKGMETCRKNGYYDSIKGKQLSPQCYAARDEYIKKLKSGEVLSYPARMKKYHPKIYQERNRKISEKRKKLVKMERFRIMSGIPRETKLRITANPYKKSQTQHRYAALKKGYWFYEDCSESSGERYNIYYDKDTKRSERFEANLKADGFNVLDGSNL